MSDAVVTLPPQIGPYRNRILGLRVMPAGELLDNPRNWRKHTRAGELCYEPFSGSGSQHVAGEQTGRLVYGLELQPQFVAVILERLAGMGLTPHQVEA